MTTPDTLPNVVKTAPERIYLVIGEDCPPEADFPRLASAAGEDMTWCEDEINANDIGYVRADIHAALADELQRLRAQVAPAGAKDLRDRVATLRDKACRDGRDFAVKTLDDVLAAFAPAQQAERELPFSGATFIQHVQSVADGGSTWADEWLKWYSHGEWLSEERAAATFLGGKLAPAPSLTVGAGPVARVVRREIAAGHDTPASHTFDVEWLTVDPFKWQGDLYAAPQPAAQAEPVAPLTLNEVRNLSAMQAGVPWTDDLLQALVECIKLYEQCVAADIRPFDPSDLDPKQHDAFWEHGELPWHGPAAKINTPPQPAVLAEMREFAAAKLPEFLGPHHMALTLSQKISEWADKLAASNPPAQSKDAAVASEKGAP